MKMKKVVAFLLSAVLLTSSMLAGCGSNEADSAESSVSGEEDSAVESSAENEAEDVEEEQVLLGEEGDRTITISTQASKGAEEGWKAVADAYMEMHPEVNVVVDLKAEDGYDQWVQTGFTSGDMTADIVAANLAGETAVDKTINFAEYFYNDSPYSEGAWMDQFDYNKQLFDTSANQCSMLSLNSVQVIWVYNADIFEEIGAEIPTTWDELVAVCEKADAAGYQALGVPGVYDSFYTGQMSWLSQIYADQAYRSMVNVIRAQPGDYCYDPDVDGVWEYDPTDPYNDVSTKVNVNKTRKWLAISDGTYSGDTPGMRTVWGNFAEVFPKYAGGDNFWGTDYDGEKALFYQGKVAMMVVGAWEIINFRNAMAELEEQGQVLDADGNPIENVKSFTLGSFNMPSMEGEGIEAKARTIETATGFLGAVSKSQAHNDMVVDFMMYYSSAEGMSIFTQAAIDAGYTVKGPSLVYGVEYPDDINAAFENLTSIGNVENDITRELARGCGESAENYRAFYQYCYEYLSGQIDLEGWVDAHCANIQERLPYALEQVKVSEKDMENPANQPTGE